MAKKLHIELDIDHIADLDGLVELVKQVGTRLKSHAPTDLGPTTRHQAWDGKMRLVGHWQISGQ